jgi:hypothetical protein
VRLAALALLMSTFTTACFSSGPTSPVYTGATPRTDIVLRTAEADLGCPLASLRVVTQTRREYLNETAFRFVVEGCGERAGYVEACDIVGEPPPAGWSTVSGSLACRDLLVTRVRLAP